MAIRSIARVVLSLALADISLAAVLPPRTPTSGPNVAALEGRQGRQQPCATVSSAIARGSSYVAPSLARACLESVPLDKDADAALLDFLAPYVNFQSNLAWLKNPTEEYKVMSGDNSSLDVLAELGELKKKVAAGTYKGQYEFTVALERLMLRARDSHTGITPRLNQVFQFARDVSVVSVSSDGLQAPQLYEVGDMVSSLTASRRSSAITHLDGAPIAAYLADLSTRTRTHDLDAGWNALFPSVPKSATGQTVADFLTLGFYAAGDFPADTSVLTLANGTRLQFRNVALPRFNFRGVTDGDALHRAVELNVATVAGRGDDAGVVERGGGDGSSEKRQSASPPSDPYADCTASHGTASRPRGYPTPIAEHADKHAGLFYLSGSNYSSTAVLQINSFRSLYAGISSSDACQTADVAEFHRFLGAAVRAFASAAGKTRLIVDLSANPGGFEATMGDVVAQLFPAQGDPRATRGFAWRTRATPALDYLGNWTWSQEAPGNPLFYNLRSGGGSGNSSSSSPPVGAMFPNWRAFFGPESLHGGEFTRLAFRDVVAERAAAGFGDVALDKAIVPDPATNMVVLTDGDCHSACAILQRWLTHPAHGVGARSVVLGGRPPSGPAVPKMQAVGGTKGGNPASFSVLQQQTALALQYAATEDIGAAADAVSDPAIDLPSPRGGPPIALGTATVNTFDVFDGIGAEAQVPQQFWFEPADCRLFYDFEMVRDIEATWKRVADVAWGGKTCADAVVGGGGAGGAGMARRGGGGLGGEERLNAEERRAEGADKQVAGADAVVTVGRVDLWGNRVEQGWEGLRTRDDLGW